MRETGIRVQRGYSALELKAKTVDLIESCHVFQKYELTYAAEGKLLFKVAYSARMLQSELNPNAWQCYSTGRVTEL